MQVPMPQSLLWQHVIAPPDQYVTASGPSLVIPQTLTQESLIPVPIMVKNGGWLVQGFAQPQPQPTYLHPPLRYVAVPSGMSFENSQMEKCIESLPPRPVLVPRGPGRGNVLNTSRSLRGNLYASRRPSEENIVTETPNKKITVDERTSSKNDVVSAEEYEEHILRTIEHYFSDENISKNSYLLKQISNENGFIHLKRITALKRIKFYTRDDRIVAQCIRRSEKLELNEDSTMVRRKDPIPANIEPPRFVRSVIAINLPQEIPTIEAVTSLFASYGDLTQVRILKPGKKLPPYLTDYQAWIPDLGTKFCALVEFESQDEAQRACREINMKNRDIESLRVALLKPGARLRRTLYRKYKGMPNLQNENESFNETGALSTEVEQNCEFDPSCSGSNSDCDFVSHHINVNTQTNFNTVGCSTIDNQSSDQIDITELKSSDTSMNLHTLPSKMEITNFSKKSNPTRIASCSSEK